ncbi:blue light sensor protein [Xylophilus rhododendri]|uniref:Blue light sensor protein n=1 Tax=Xylophilus rhododendri TaxID=2697032 RepID=A0A857J0I7_9BURK|nr:BLUF domain-containing protein [Xylophilus rhododendri]QHI97374.1 blue light sensor protein [Xylophilus rhododendri]
MKQVFYVSQALGRHAAIPSILSSARRRNLALNVTGSLLFTGGYFAQVLEGEEPALAEVMALIAADARHRDIRILLDRALDMRLFSAWSMAYTELPGMEDLLQQLGGAQAVAPERADKLIRLMFDRCSGGAVS